MQSLNQLLAERSQQDDCGLFFQDRYWTYAELIGEAAHQAQTLLDLGLAGQRLMLISDNSVELVQALLAAWWAGCVPVCLPPPARLQQAGTYADFLERALRECQATPGWCQSKLLKRLPAGWQELPLARADQAAAVQSPAPLAYLQFSSGTTLDPKPTALSHANVMHNLEAIASQLPGSRRQHSCVSWLPLYHDMGLVGCLLSALYAPGSLSLMTPTQFALRPGSWLDEISRRKATISVAPNFALELLLQRDGEAAPDRNLSSLRMLLLGAETIRPDTLRRFHQRYGSQGLDWQALTPVYGLAEATLAVTFSRRPKIEHFQLPGEIGEAVTAGARPLVSLGRPLPGVQLSILDPQGRPLAGGHLGHIHVAGPSLAGDLPSPYDTGDIGFLWEDELYFVSRFKDVLVYHGRKHDPDVLECLVQPLDSAAVASSDESVVCLVERPRRPTVDDASLLQDLQHKLSQAPLPVQAKIVDSGWLPRTSSGKISRYRARVKFHVAD